MDIIIGIFQFLADLHNLPGVDAEMGEIFQKIVEELTK